ncbi:MAG: rhomboid family intramembrane serine protease [Verrucomicrobium sp.]
MNPHLRRQSLFPALVATTIVLATLLIHICPGLPASLQWDRGNTDQTPNPWQIGWLTGHLVHWSSGHLVWDLGAFVVLSVLCLRLLPGGYVPALLIAAVLIPLEVRLFQSQFTTYRGLSGLDSALFGLAVMALWHQPTASSRWLACTSAAGFLAKTGFEIITGTTLFVPPEISLYSPVPSAHLVGFAAGLAGGFIKLPRMDAGRSPAKRKLPDVSARQPQ